METTFKDYPIYKKRDGKGEHLEPLEFLEVMDL